MECIQSVRERPCKGVLHEIIELEANCARCQLQDFNWATATAAGRLKARSDEQDDANISPKDTGH